MGHLDKLLGIAALMLGLLVLIGFMMIDANSQGIKAETKGEDTLAHLINNGNAVHVDRAVDHSRSTVSQQVMS